ncbi:MAG: hypothetical protein HRT57_04190, partial [Crocinitomicaceae bacterium]|nr:hypothetical protein [Crocinitomicaceae bacterium]
MKLKKRKLYTRITSLAAIAFSCQEIDQTEFSQEKEALPYYDDPAFSPHWITPEAVMADGF